MTRDLRRSHLVAVPFHSALSRSDLEHGNVILSNVEAQTLPLALFPSVKLLPAVRGGLKSRDVAEVDRERAGPTSGRKSDNHSIAEGTRPVRIELSRDRRRGVGWLEVTSCNTEFVLVDVNDILVLLVAFVPADAWCLCQRYLVFQNVK